mmetsp:Transcript_7072/g.21313  ORF Transcript_7072/g.21313 Transcript_7072/m.21313 type:complete len:274 (+) Transcript_7072:1398-2219(+)
MRPVPATCCSPATSTNLSSSFASVAVVAPLQQNSKNPNNAFRILLFARSDQSSMQSNPFHSFLLSFVPHLPPRRPPRIRFSLDNRSDPQAKIPGRRTSPGVGSSRTRTPSLLFLLYRSDAAYTVFFFFIIFIVFIISTLFLSFFLSFTLSQTRPHTLYLNIHFFLFHAFDLVFNFHVQLSQTLDVFFTGFPVTSAVRFQKVRNHLSERVRVGFHQSLLHFRVSHVGTVGVFVDPVVDLAGGRGPTESVVQSLLDFASAFVTRGQHAFVPFWVQ